MSTRLFVRHDVRPFQPCLAGLFSVLLCVSVARSEPRTASVTGDWSDTATWGGSAVPGAGDTVTINPNVTVTVDAPASCASIAILAANAVNGLAISGTQTLTVSGAITTVIPAADNRHTTIDVGGGSLTAGSIALAGGGTPSRYTLVTISTGTVEVSGNFTGSGIASMVTFTGAGTLRLGGTFLGASPTFTSAPGCTVHYTGAAQTVKAGVYSHLILSGSGLKTTTSVTVNGVLSLEGTATVSAVPTYGADATLQYNLGIVRTNGVEWKTPFTSSGGVVITNTGTLFMNANKVFNAGVPLIVASGATLNISGFTSLSLGGDFETSGTLTAGSCGILISGTAAVQRIGGFTSAGGLYVTKTAGTATLTGNVNAGLLTTSGIGGTLHLGEGLTHSFTGWTRTGGTVHGGSSTLKLAGTPTSTVTLFIADSGTVDYNALAAQGVKAHAYNNLVLSGGGVKTIDSGTAVAGNLSIAPAGDATASVGTGINIPVGSLTLGGVGRINGTWGSTSAPGATYQTNLYFAPATGFLTVATDTRSLTPTVTTWPAASSITYGQTLSDSTLSGGAGSVDGDFVFTAPAVAPDAGTLAQAVTFLPADIGTYHPVTGTTSVTVGPRVVSLAGRRPYDGTMVANSGILRVANKVGGDTVTVASGSGTLADAGDPDEARAVAIASLGDLALGNNALGNYTLAGADGLVAIVDESAADATWITTGGTNDWFDPANWWGGFLPFEGCDAVITNTGTTVFLADPTPVMNSLVVGSIILCSNWNTALSAATITVASNGVLTHVVNSATNAPWVADARVWVVCSNFTLAAGGSINALGKGYWNPTTVGFGYGPGTNGFALCGAGHGGRGGDYGVSSGLGSMQGGGVTYDTLEAPTEPGSGGAPNSTYGGAGGGAVRIEATGTVAINGFINADGGKAGGTYSACGSGGSVYITCSSMTGAGTGSVISANGGLKGTVGQGGYSGGGGGGRIAVAYDVNAQGGVPIPETRFSAAGSLGPYYVTSYGYAGTLYFPDNRFLTNVFVHSGEWNVPGFTEWTVGDLVVSNGGWLKFPAGFQLTVTNQLVVCGGPKDVYPVLTRLEIDTGALNCSGDILVTNGAIKLYANAPGPAAVVGATLNCEGTLTLAAGADNTSTSNNLNNLLGLYCHKTNGSYAVVTARNFVLNRGGRVETAGYNAGYGPGRGTGGAVGGSYGGLGAASAAATVGSTYGQENAPLEAGSPGFAASLPVCGPGGGVIRIIARNGMRLDGLLNATGFGGATGLGVGSGGSIYLTCRTLEGTYGVLKAEGAVCNLGYSGGGGRIAVERGYDLTGGMISNSAAGGAYVGNNTYDGTPGTVVWTWRLPKGTLISIR